MLDAVRGSFPLPDAGAYMPATATAPTLLQLAGAHATGPIDLPAHLQQLAADDQLVPFLDQTRDAIALAREDPYFAESMTPMLSDIRAALGTLPTDRLSRDEQNAVQDTRTQLDDFLGVDQTDEVPGGGLPAHEAAGAHLIDKHVGKSEQELLDRLDKENISASSSFVDLPSAEHFCAQTIHEHQAQIDAWLAGKGGNRLVIDSTFDAKTGISVERGQDHAVDTHSVKLVLERSDKLGIGYRIVTGYPETP